MEIINKKHEEIKNKERSWLVSFITFEDSNMIYFSAESCRRFGFKKGDSINFIKDGDMWWLYIDRSMDGFELVGRKMGRGGKHLSLVIRSSPLIKYFLNNTKCSLPCKFPLTLTKSKMNGSPLIKIEINKPLE